MMSEEQRRAVIEVYNYLMEGEKRGWDNLDNSIVYLEYLDDSQLCIEADTVYAYHVSENAHCHKNHPASECFITRLLEAVGAILELHGEMNTLHERSRYILQYYLAMNQEEMIVVD